MVKNILYSPTMLHMRCHQSWCPSFPRLALARRYLKTSQVYLGNTDYHGSNCGYTPFKLREELRELYGVVGVLALAGE